MADAGDNTVPLRTLAIVLDVDVRRVQQLAKEGVVVRGTGRGRYLLVPSVQGYIRYLRKRVVAGDAGDELRDAQVRLTRSRAEESELAAKERREELLPFDDLEPAWIAVASAIRSRMVALPAKGAPLAHGARTVAQAEAYLQTLVDEILHQLSAATVNQAAPGASPRRRAGSLDAVGDAPAAPANGARVGR